MINMKKKTHMSITINEYVMRALVVKGPSMEQLALYEVSLPKNVIKDGAITDEMTLFEIMKDNASNWGGKRQNVRFLVPDTSVLFKTFEHPPELTGKKVKEFVQMELGQSIHLPFQEPLVDVYDTEEGDGQAVLFAAPSEEVGKMIGLLLDNHFHPQVADIRALCNLRLLKYIQFIGDKKTYLVTDWSMNELSICIFSNGNVEFLRFQGIETDAEKWQAEVLENGEVQFHYNGEQDEYRSLVLDQILELDRIMNFFKFSLHKGEKVVDEIIVMGEHPLLTTIELMLSDNLSTPVKIVGDVAIGAIFPNCKAKHATLLGLALKEVNI